VTLANSILPTLTHPNRTQTTLTIAYITILASLDYVSNNTCGGLSGWVGLHLIEKWAILHTCVLVGVFDVSVFDVGVFDVGVFDVGNLTVGKFFFDLDHFNNDSMNVRKLEIDIKI
jgi:hypothetical protein